MTPEVGKDQRRSFTASQRLKLFVEAGGRCQRCRRELPEDWHAHHIQPHSQGGLTEIENGMALCPPCHTLEHQNMTTNPAAQYAPFNKDYSWQERAVDYYLDKRHEFYSSHRGQIDRAYVVEVSPSGGKTIFSMKLAQRMIIDGLIDRVVWCVPRDSIKLGFEDDARILDPMPPEYRLIGESGFRVDTKIDSKYAARSGLLPNYHGVVITYQALPGLLDWFRLLSHEKRLMFVFDEAHHGAGGEEDDAQNIWGEAMRQCGSFANAVVCMTGTPLRSDDQRVPFLQYEEITANDGDEVRHGFQVQPDFSFGYADAVEAGVARRITIRNQDPDITYAVRGYEYTGRVSVIPRGHLQRVKRTAFCLDRGVVDDFLKIAWQENELQRSAGGGNDEDAAILVIGARDIGEAENTLPNIGERILTLFGERPVTVESSDGDRARRRIADFKRGSTRWIVAKEMISEGTNLPRIRTIVILRDIGNRVFYEQLVHRSTRNDADDRHQDAIIIQAAFPNLVEWGNDLEQQARIGWEKQKITRTIEPGPGGDGPGEQPEIEGILAQMSEESINIAGQDFTEVDPIARELFAAVGDSTHASRWQMNRILDALPRAGYRIEGGENSNEYQPFTIEERCDRLKENAARYIKKSAKLLGGQTEHYKRLYYQCKRAAGIGGRLEDVMRDHPDPLQVMALYEKEARRCLEIVQQQVNKQRSLL